jgi:SAM-dependent methyltransferase
MPPLSRYAAKKKIDYFFRRIPKSAAILEIGPGSGWAGDYLLNNGWSNYTGLDLVSPADVVGDIKDWRRLGLREGSFDVILAFEVVEHVDCFHECYDLLTPEGILMVTTPVPHMDWALKLLEILGLNQKRTSPHEHLVYLSDISLFPNQEVRTIAFLAQWGILTMPTAPRAAATAA